jgi:hypothetical protein
MSVPCECICGCNLFQLSVIRQVNGNNDTYEIICNECGREYGFGNMVIQSDDDVPEN